MVRCLAQQRTPLSETQRKAKPAVSHPIFLDHPITRRKVLYANPGYATHINKLPEADSETMLEKLFHIKPKPASNTHMPGMWATC